MLSGEGNQNGEKTTIGLISIKTTLHVQHTFFVHFFAVALHNHNVKLPETSELHVLWKKCCTCYCSLFFTRSFSPWWPLGFLIFHVVLPTNSPLSSALALCRSFSRWNSLACRPLYFFLCSKFVDMTINLTLDNKDTETISAFRFRLYWLFSCLCFTRRRWLCDFPPK